MRTVSWASLLAIITFASAQAQDSIALPDGGTLSYAAIGAKTRFEIRTKAGKAYVLSVLRDGTVPVNAAPTKVDVFGTIQGLAFILADTYASIPGGMSYCQAGEERFLRVFSIARRPARETFRIKLESCRQTVELANSGLNWEPARATLQLNWLQGPSAQGGSQSQEITFDAEGGVRTVRGVDKPLRVRSESADEKGSDLNGTNLNQ